MLNAVAVNNSSTYLHCLGILLRWGSCGCSMSSPDPSFCVSWTQSIICAEFQRTHKWAPWWRVPLFLPDSHELIGLMWNIQTCILCYIHQSKEHFKPLGAGCWSQCSVIGSVAAYTSDGGKTPAEESDWGLFLERRGYLLFSAKQPVVWRKEKERSFELQCSSSSSLLQNFCRNDTLTVHPFLLLQKWQYTGHCLETTCLLKAV